LALIVFAAALMLMAAMSLPAQSSRPRRVAPTPTPTPDTLLGPPPKSSPTVNRNAPLLDVRPSKPVGDAPATTATNTTTNTAPAVTGPDTTHAFQLFQQHQYAQAAREAKAVAAVDPTNSEAWKLAGFSEFYLKQYNDASSDLQKALELQRKAGPEDSHTVDALAESYTLGEKFEQALPLLVNYISSRRYS